MEPNNPNSDQHNKMEVDEGQAQTQQNQVSTSDQQQDQTMAEESKSAKIQTKEGADQLDQDPKSKFKINLMKLIPQIKQGCKKDICFNKYCQKNPLAHEKLKFSSDSELVRQAIKIMQSVNDGDQLLCSDATSVSKFTLETINEKQIQEVMEDAYAFTSSFVAQLFSKEQVEEASAFAEPDSSLMVVKSIADRSPIKYFEIDFESLDAFLKKMEKSYPDEEAVRKAAKQLVQIIHFEYKQQNQTREAALMAFRGMLMIMQLEQLYDWNWYEVFEVILEITAEVVKAMIEAQDTIYVDFLRIAITKHRLLSSVQKMQSMITISIMSGLFKSESIKNCIIVLDVFNEANEKRDIQHKIDFKEFYNDAINKEVNLTDHIKLWLVERQKAKKEGYTFNRHKVFSFCCYSWVLDAANKSDILKSESQLQQSMQQNQSIMDLFLNPSQGIDRSLYMSIKVHRDNILEDTLKQITNSSISFKKPLRVQFIGEPGVDEGGVRKEFFQLLIKQLFDPMYGMFTYNEKQRLYWFNGQSHEPPINFELIGILMGLAIYNQVILGMPFPLACYKQLVFHRPNFDDLREWQPEIAQSLEYILNYNEERPLEEVLGTTFTIQVESWGEMVDVELRDGGSKIYVTKENKEEYVELYIDYIFNKQCERQIRSFQKGFYRVCNEDIITQMFKPEELELLVCGSPKLDFHAWEKTTRYIDGYSADHQVIKWFWQVVHEMEDSLQKKFLSFCTGSDRAPILGLGSLQLFVGRHGDDNTRLPSAHTCFNHLLIPEYSSKEILKEKLLQAIENSEGFGLI